MLWVSLLMVKHAKAVEPTFFLVKEINFGALMFLPGSCQMDPETGVLSPFNGRFLCSEPSDASNAEYIIRLDPNKMVRLRIKPDLNNNDGYIFNPKAKAISQSGTVEIYNEPDFVEVNSGGFGQINIYIGGELTIISSPPPSTPVNFSYADAILWELIF